MLDADWYTATDRALRTEESRKYLHRRNRSIIGAPLLTWTDNRYQFGLTDSFQIAEPGEYQLRISCEPFPVAGRTETVRLVSNVIKFRVVRPD